MADGNEFLVNSLASSLAGISARVVCHPVDTLKARLQAPSAAASGWSSTIGTLRGTIAEEGLRGLYRGFPAVLLGGTPGTMMYLVGYEYSKARLRELNHGQETVAVHLTSGMLAETLCCLVYVPVDVIKERMQVQRGVDGPYRSTGHALVRIARTEGLSGVYRGYGATLLSFGPFSALYFAFYEQLKWNLSAGEARPLPFSWTVAASAVAGGGAAFLTSPLDMAKLRLQVQRGDAAYAGQRYSSMVDALMKIPSREGPRALFRGSLPRVLFQMPSTAISMGVFEECRKVVRSAMGDA